MSNIRRSMRFASLLSILLCPSCKKNHPPDAPVAPAGPASGRVDIFYQFMTATTDPDGDDICYRFSWGDGGTSDWSPFIASGDTAAASHLWAAPGRYQVKTQAMDRQGATSGWSAAHGLVLVANSPPDRPPQPSGPDECSACVAYEFACCATDPDGDRVAIRIDWGDGDTSGWSIWVASGDTVTMSHIWYSRSRNEVKAQAKDYYHATSEWSAAHTVFVGSNRPPGAPSVPSGPSAGWILSPHSFSAAATDPDGDRVAVRFDWGDGDTSDWSMFVGSGVPVECAHTWVDTGSFVVRAQSKDERGALSGWSAGRALVITELRRGTLRWRYRTGSRYDGSSPAIGADGAVYVRSGCYLYAVNPNGTPKWCYWTSEGGFSSPAIAADGTVYFGCDDRYLYAINPNGSLKWRYLTSGSVFSSPALGPDGTVYVGSEEGYYLYALNPNGTLKWRYQTGDYICSSPAIDSDGTVYFGSNGPYLYALNPNGTLKWTYQTGGIYGSSPAIDTDGTVYVGSGDSHLYALNPDGTLKWNYRTGSDVGSPTVGSDGTVYVGSADNCLYAIDAGGTLKWRYETGGQLGHAPAIAADGTVYVGSRDNCLYAVSSDGSLKWRYETDDEIYCSPAVGADGTVYVWSSDGYTYAIYGDSPLAASPWPKFHHDNRNTGRVGGGK